MRITTRPLSPHLQIYKWQITSITSILHRMTGILVSLGFFVLAYWMFSVIRGEEYYSLSQSFFKSWLGKIALFGWTWSFYYHFCNGIRHLFWDMGKGYELKTARLTGWLAIATSIFLTFISWIIAFVDWV